jgi:ribosomal-protein-alanine N-acetyltransferase
MQTAFTLRPWAITDLASLVKHANNWNVAKNMTDKFPFPYSEAAGRGFIAFATQGNPISIFAIEVDGLAVGAVVHKDVAANTIVGGIPARVLKTIEAA